MGDLIDLADYRLARAWRRAAIGQDTETASACLAASRKLMRKVAGVSQEAAPARVVASTGGQQEAFAMVLG